MHPRKLGRAFLCYLSLYVRVCVRAFGASDLFFPLSDAPGRRINHDVGGKEGEANQTLPLFRFCSRRTARESKKVSRIIRLSSAGLFFPSFSFFHWCVCVFFKCGAVCFLSVCKCVCVHVFFSRCECRTPTDRAVEVSGVKC